MTDAMTQEQLEQWIRDKEYDCSTDHDLEMVVSVGDLRTLFAGRRLVQAEPVRCDCCNQELTSIYAECGECKKTFGVSWLPVDSTASTTEALQPASPDKEVWRPIETAPKDGKPIIVFHPEGGVCEAFCPGDGFAWHCMDGVNTRIGEKSGKSLPTLTSFLLPPTHWMPLPTPPSDQVVGHE